MRQILSCFRQMHKVLFLLLFVIRLVKEQKIRINQVHQGVLDVNLNSNGIFLVRAFQGFPVTPENLAGGTSQQFLDKFNVDLPATGNGKDGELHGDVKFANIINL